MSFLVLCDLKPLLLIGWSAFQMELQGKAKTFGCSYGLIPSSAPSTLQNRLNPRTFMEFFNDWKLFWMLLRSNTNWREKISQPSFYEKLRTNDSKWDIVGRGVFTVKIFTIFTKRSILDIWQSSEYVSHTVLQNKFGVFQKIFPFIFQQKML